VNAAAEDAAPDLTAPDPTAPDPTAPAAEGEAKRPIGGLLRQRNFSLLWFGETISGIGSSMAGVGVPLLAVAVLHASTFAVSALTAAAWLPWLIIGLPAGAWVDRWPAKPVLIVADLALAVLYVSLPIAAWLHQLTIGQVIVVELLAGAADVFFTTAYVVYLPVLVSDADLMEGNAKLQGSGSVASVSGRGLAGLAIRAVGEATSLLFNAGSFLVSAFCLFAIRASDTRRAQAPPRTNNLRADIAYGLKYLWRNPLLRILAIWPAVSNMAYGGVIAISILFLVRVVGIGAAELGLLLAVANVGGVAGALVARRLARRVGTARALQVNVLVAGLAAVLIPLTQAGPLAVLFVVGSGVVTGCITATNIVLISWRQAYIPKDIQGRTASSQRFLIYGTAPLGALLAGALGTALGIRPGLWAVTGIFAASGFLLLASPIRANRDLPPSPEPLQSPEPEPVT
jgi:Na+/melibiose symporter-like transporter